MHKRRSGQNINKRSIANGQCSNRRHPLLPLCRWTEIQKHVAPVANKQIWACVNEKQVPQVEASLPIVPKSCKEEVHGCSIYAKLSLRNDGPGDGALLSRRGSSASGWITPELSLSLSFRWRKGGEGLRSGERKKRKKGENGKLPKPDRSYPLPDVVLSFLPSIRFFLDYPALESSVLHFEQRFFLFFFFFSRSTNRPFFQL